MSNRNQKKGDSRITGLKQKDDKKDVVIEEDVGFVSDQ